MAKDLIMQKFRHRQSGFSLVEMLAAAFIMAIGILGILTLQMMAIRATKGTSNMSTAARIAEQIIDQAEMEGRLSWLNITDGNRTAPNLGDLDGFQLKYIVLEVGKELVEEYNVKGDLVVKGGEAHEDSMASAVFFTVATRREKIDPLGAPNPVGAISDFKVRVTFADVVGADKQVITRIFNLSRRIIHG
jgi:prepilin-type N-terminal cleavage/methylation domain-containing protein